MSQNLLFACGTAVFAVTVCATLLYGYFYLDRIYQADLAEQPVVHDEDASVRLDRDLDLDVALDVALPTAVAAPFATLR